MLVSKLQTKDKLAVLSVRDNANGWCVLDTIAWLGWDGTEPLAYLMEGIQPHELYTVLKTRDNRGETIIHHFVMMDIHKEVLEETMTTLTEYMQRELLDIEDMQGRSPYYMATEKLRSDETNAISHWVLQQYAKLQTSQILIMENVQGKRH